jgi:hypothetical protein
MAAVLRVDNLVPETEYVASQYIIAKYRKFHEDRFSQEGGASFSELIITETSPSLSQ